MDSSGDNYGISQQPVHSSVNDTGHKNQRPTAYSPGGADAVDGKRRGLRKRSPSSVDMNIPNHDSGTDTAAVVPACRSNLNDADAPAHFPNSHHRQIVDDEGEFRGVTMRPSGKWQVQIYYAGKSRYLGVYESKLEASLVYKNAIGVAAKSPLSSSAPSDKIKQVIQIMRQVSFNEDTHGEKYLPKDTERPTRQDTSAESNPKPKRGRGRPRKLSRDGGDVPKRGRGRPRKRKSTDDEETYTVNARRLESSDAAAEDGSRRSSRRKIIPSKLRETAYLESDGDDDDFSNWRENGRNSAGGSEYAHGDDFEDSGDISEYEVEPKDSYDDGSTDQGPRAAQTVQYWTDTEKAQFARAVTIEGWGRWKNVESYIPTRTNLQIRNYGNGMNSRAPQEVKRLKLAHKKYMKDATIVSGGTSQKIQAQSVSGSREISGAKLERGRRETYQHWTPEEDALLQRVVEEYGAKDWNGIASNLPGRKSKQCRDRWHKVVSNGQSSGDGEEDVAVVDHEAFVNGAISRFCGIRRTDDNLYESEITTTESLRRKFTQEEEIAFIRGLLKYGFGKWKKIYAEYPILHQIKFHALKDRVRSKRFIRLYQRAEADRSLLDRPDELCGADDLQNYNVNDDSETSCYSLGKYDLFSDAAWSYDEATRLLGKERVNFESREDFLRTRDEEMRIRGGKVSLRNALKSMSLALVVHSWAEDYDNNQEDMLRLEASLGFTSKSPRGRPRKNGTANKSGRAASSKRTAVATKPSSEKGEAYIKKLLSSFMGVRQFNKNFESHVVYNHNYCSLGRFELLCDAAWAYDEAVRCVKDASWDKFNFEDKEAFMRARQKEMGYSGSNVELRDTIDAIRKKFTFFNWPYETEITSSDFGPIASQAPQPAKPAKKRGRGRPRKVQAAEDSDPKKPKRRSDGPKKVRDEETKQAAEPGPTLGSGPGQPRQLFDTWLDDRKRTWRKKRRYWPQTDINSQQICNHDCLLVQGRSAIHHPGNVRCRRLIDSYRSCFAKGNTEERVRIALEIVTKWRSLDPPGRFLKKEKNTENELSDQLWYDVGDKLAQEIIRQNFAKNPSQSREKTSPESEDADIATMAASTDGDDSESDDDSDDDEYYISRAVQLGFPTHMLVKKTPDEVRNLSEQHDTEMDALEVGYTSLFLSDKSVEEMRDLISIALSIHDESIEDTAPASLVENAATLGIAPGALEFCTEDRARRLLSTQRLVSVGCMLAGDCAEEMAALQVHPKLPKAKRAKKKKRSTRNENVVAKYLEPSPREPKGRAELSKPSPDDPTQFQWPVITNVTDTARQALVDWFLENQSHPYPPRSEKDRLADAYGLTGSQIDSWFFRARRKLGVMEKRKTLLTSSADTSRPATRPTSRRKSTNDVGENRNDSTGFKFPTMNEVPEEGLSHLRSWFLRNKHSPYPTQAQRDEFKAMLGCTAAQLDGWFCRARKYLARSESSRKRSSRDYADADSGNKRGRFAH